MEATVPQGINRRRAFDVTDSLKRRLEAGIARGADTDCWPWTGATRNSYGAIKHQGCVLSTHVVAYVIANGPVPEGHLVTHSCDNKLCCNPAHLKAGTPRANVREMYERISVRKARGELAPNAKLTNDVARFLLAAHVLGAGPKKLSEEMGLSFSTVRSVLQRRTWRHVAVPTRDEAERIVREAV